MKRILLALLCLAGAATVALAATKSAPPPPNVVLIISDDQAWTDYGFMGHPHIQTPHLDRLASQSLLFPRGYVPASLCCPSLASIVSGRYPHQHQVTSNDPPAPAGMTDAKFRSSPAFGEGREVMNRHLEAVPTLPRLLAQKGYASFQSGKWWQGHYSRGGFTQGMTRGERHGDDGLDIGRKTMQPIYDFIADARRSNQPFLVWYAPMMPHQPHNPPARLLEKYKDKSPSLLVAKYWAMVEWFDETIGQLLTHLEEGGLAENTLVIYITDNGWIQDPAAARYAAKSKQSPYDGGLRTPIMLRWPGHIKPQRSEALAQSIDLLPTILKAAGAKPPRGLPGLDLLDRKAVGSRKAIFGECFTHTAVDLDRPAASLRWRWMIEGDWKLLVPALANEPDAKVQLYNLTRDPREENDLAAQEPGRVRQFNRALDRWWSPR